jgi:predicted RNA-binding Zn-ribbon protein involved in translation (DUF1610 family)
MPTIGEVYDPIITAALEGDLRGHELLKEAGLRIFEHNPDKCSSAEDGIEAARENLAYYCQYCDEETVIKVKDFYELGREQRMLVR